jgi:hypothetical protein
MSWQPGESGNPGRRWQPGQSGNPAGRPRKRPVRALLTQIGEATEINGKLMACGGTALEQLCINLWEWALAGDSDYVRILLDRAYGTVEPAEAAEEADDARAALAILAQQKVREKVKAATDTDEDTHARPADRDRG